MSCIAAFAAGAFAAAAAFTTAAALLLLLLDGHASSKLRPMIVININAVACVMCPKGIEIDCRTAQSTFNEQVSLTTTGAGDAQQLVITSQQ